MARRTIFNRLQSVVEHREARAIGNLSPHLDEARLPDVDYLRGQYLDQVRRTHPDVYPHAMRLVEVVAGGGAERRG